MEKPKRQTEGPSRKPEPARKSRMAGKVPAKRVADPKGLSGGSFVAGFMDEDGRVRLNQVAKSFGMSSAQLAETMGVSPQSVYRGSPTGLRKSQVRATEMLEIVARITLWAGGARQAMAWYRAEPIPAFGGQTAEALVRQGKAGAVREYLDHLALGGFA